MEWAHCQRTCSICNLFLKEWFGALWVCLEEEGLYMFSFICLFLLGAGADFVMMGGMFAGHDQSGKECLISYYIFMSRCCNSKHFKLKISLTYYNSNNQGCLYTFCLSEYLSVQNDQQC